MSENQPERQQRGGQGQGGGAAEPVEKRSGYTEGQKGIINMPDVQVLVDVQDMAPGGLPAPAQSAPPGPPAGPPPASPEQ
jgi:hypothetical protein